MLFACERLIFHSNLCLKEFVNVWMCVCVSHNTPFVWTKINVRWLISIELINPLMLTRNWMIAMHSTINHYSDKTNGGQFNDETTTKTPHIHITVENTHKSDIEIAFRECVNKLLSWKQFSFFVCVRSLASLHATWHSPLIEIDSSEARQYKFVHIEISYKYKYLIVIAVLLSFSKGLKMFQRNTQADTATKIYRDSTWKVV